MVTGSAVDIVRAAIVAIPPIPCTGQPVAALGADQERRKEEYPSGGVGFGVIGQELWHGVKQLTGDNGRTEIFIDPPVAFIVADIQGLA